jgi:hypothetical protein
VTLAEPPLGLSHDVFHLLDGETELGFELSASDQLADPLFVDRQGRDFRLREQSPAIDAGADLGYTIDFAGHPVPTGSSADIGAHEHQPEATLCSMLARETDEPSVDGLLDGGCSASGTSPTDLCGLLWVLAILGLFAARSRAL